MQSNDARISPGRGDHRRPCGIVAAVVSALVAGGKGLIGGLVALVVVAVLFGLGLAALMRLTRDNAPSVQDGRAAALHGADAASRHLHRRLQATRTLFHAKAFALTLLVTALPGWAVRCGTR